MTATIKHEYTIESLVKNEMNIFLSIQSYTFFSNQQITEVKKAIDKLNETEKQGFFSATQSKNTGDILLKYTQRFMLTDTQNRKELIEYAKNSGKLRLYSLIGMLFTCEGGN